MYSNLKIVLISSCLLCCTSYAAVSQVTVNQSALDTLNNSKENSNQSVKKTKTKHRFKPKTINNSTPSSPKPVKQHDVTEKAGSSSPPALPTIPNAPPPVPVIKQEELKVPLHPPAPPPMPKIIQTAHGTAEVSPSKTVIVFDRDGIDLNKTMMKAVMDFADSLKRNQNIQAYLNAYSHDNPDDPSTPRRLALERGLVIRAVLINQGIAPTRLYLMVKTATTLEKAMPKNLDSVELWRSDRIDSVKNKP